jgi:signal transduction histidine kinase
MLIIDQGGLVIAHPDPAKGVRLLDGKAVVASVADLGDPVAVKALQEHEVSNNLAVLILSLMVLEVLLIVVFAKRITRPIKAVTEEIQRVQSLNFDQKGAGKSVIREIDNLQSAAHSMEHSLVRFPHSCPLAWFVS